jgi:hypothetical protein
MLPEICPPGADYVFAKGASRHVAPAPVPDTMTAAQHRPAPRVAHSDRNISYASEFTLGPRGFANCEATMHSLSPADAFLAIATLGTAALIEIGAFILIGLI